MRVPKRLRRDRRNLMLKVRVVVTEPGGLPKREVLRRVQETIQTGMLAQGIEIHYLDWAKGSGRKVNAGRVDGSLLEELQRFAGAFEAMKGPRVERAE